MTDRRVTPDPRYVDDQTPARVGVPVVDLLAAPHGARDRQLLAGDPVTVLGTHDAHSYVRSEKDGYIGWVAATALAADAAPTHVVTALASHAYAAATFKSPDRATLSFGARLVARGVRDGYLDTAYGYVPAQHVSPADWQADDPVQVAALFLGTPYLWGGNSRLGLDCSGLIQAALLACGHACPGDSDQQQALGRAATGAVQRGDLLFWKGHVAIAVDDQTLIHANAYAMATVYEPLAQAVARIAETDGPVLARRRL
ncbi:MAG: NlpC/P60 family protein [Pseudomonadota bacterium]